jgi:hypothetical protein
VRALGDSARATSAPSAAPSLRRVLRDDLAASAAGGSGDVSDAVLEVLRALIDVFELLPDGESAPAALASLAVANLQ